MKSAIIGFDGITSPPSVYCTAGSCFHCVQMKELRTVWITYILCSRVYIKLIFACVRITFVAALIELCMQMYDGPVRR